MTARPILRRYYKGECTMCGRRLHRGPLVSSRFPNVVYLGEHLWCRRCADTARNRSRPPRQFAVDELVRYVRALNEWADAA